VYADAIVPLLEDAFETEQGWAGGAPGDTATTGIWERVEPAGTVSSLGVQIQPEVDNTVFPGTLCFITGQQPGANNNIGANDVDNGFTTLTSPLIDASAGGDVSVEYALWYSNDANNAIDDSLIVEISNDDGQSWFGLEALATSTNGWETRSFPLAGIVTPTATMRVRFIASDTGAGSIVEAAVDDFAISVTQCAAGLPADLNGDGSVDSADLGILIGLFGTADPQADINGDGVVNSADLGILIGAFGAGV
jgi:Dockerin type I domain